MDAEQLRALQAPLKERYRKDPGAARITLCSEGRVGEGVTCCTDAAPEEVRTLLRLTERYCVVYQTLCRAPEIAVSYETSAG
ncbi:MAG: OsmC family protein [Candidatus Eiseniibacteriota bacterium]